MSAIEEALEAYGAARSANNEYDNREAVARTKQEVMALLATWITGTPVSAIERVLAMATEMSGETSYQDFDEETGDGPLGVREEVQRDLDLVHAWLAATKRVLR